MKVDIAVLLAPVTNQRHLAWWQLVSREYRLVFTCLNDLGDLSQGVGGVLYDEVGRCSVRNVRRYIRSCIVRAYRRQMMRFILVTGS